MIEKDCLLIGFNDTDFPDFVKMMRGMGEVTGSFRDLNLAFTDAFETPLRCLDLLNNFLEEEGLAGERPYENVDFIWPVILYLGSYLHRRGYSFDYINLFHREKTQLVELLKNNRYRAVAITTTVYVSPHPIIEVVEFLRECGIDSPIVIGGPYISSQHRVMSQEELATLFSFVGGDLYVISAEGEATLVRVLECLRSGVDLNVVPNLAVRKNADEYDFTAIDVEKNDLAAEPINYSLFGADRLGEFISLRTAKSCPFACNFCGFPQRAGKYSYTGLDVVARELDALAELGSVSTLTFLDDTFNVPKRRFKDILRLMIERSYDFHWNSFYRADHGDEETIELMAAAGCEGVFLGIESGSNHMLELMNKTARKHHYANALERFRQNNITSYASLIIGFPGETMDTVMETIEFIETHRPTVYRAQLFYLDPATPVWRDREQYRISGGGFEWQHPTMNNHQASDIIERMFLEIKNSIWAPQHGFEDWSLYYLQRRGFTIEEVLKFVHNFNELVRLKFNPQERTSRQPILLQSMRELAITTRKRFLETPEIRKPFLHPRDNSHEVETSLIIPVHSI